MTYPLSYQLTMDRPGQLVKTHNTPRKPGMDWMH